jgi:hypothetical protein
MNETEELQLALRLLHEVYLFQYCDSIHQRIKGFLVKHGKENPDAEN